MLKWPEEYEGGGPRFSSIAAGDASKAMGAMLKHRRKEERDGFTCRGEIGRARMKQVEKDVEERGTSPCSRKAVTDITSDNLRKQNNS